VIRKIEEGYFDELGITALWLTPYFEQIHGSTDESTGMTFGYHGYWIKDWTSIDPNFGTEEDLTQLVETAHAHGIRIVMDVVINHTGPVTEKDPVWPEEWVRTSPKCTYQDYETTVSCTLVENLPDIRTDSNDPVELPPSLMEKWEQEGRLHKEMAELDLFFERTGYPRAPRFYIIKWLTDFIRKYGIDGYRLDTAKHIEESIWGELGKESRIALLEWKNQHPDKVLDENDFYMVAEVYGYGIKSGRNFWFGDRDVDFFNHGIHSMINFDFKNSASQDYETLFSSYSDILYNELKGKGVLNYFTSHDDGEPFDKGRKKPLEAGTKLLLTPGTSQIYYGDESCRELIIPGTEGDATLRGVMNWEEIENNSTRNGFSVGLVMSHYRKLGQFRRDHPSVGAGQHQMLTSSPYTFSRSFKSGDYSDHVVVGLDLEPGEKTVKVENIFEDGTQLYDYYSSTSVVVKHGQVTFASANEIVLLGVR
ncbi:MAG: alpha-amylase family glycosyl hydrolase, partial [Bacteroidota bacterium]